MTKPLVVHPLLFAHLILPHPPFVFDAEGNPVTPVNTFRLIFNQLFGGDYERLPDRAFYSEYAAPYDFIDVTGGVVAP